MGCVGIFASPSLKKDCVSTGADLVEDLAPAPKSGDRGWAKPSSASNTGALAHRRGSLEESLLLAIVTAAVAAIAAAPPISSTLSRRVADRSGRRPRPP